jgi:hypothetical protein
MSEAYLITLKRPSGPRGKLTVSSLRVAHPEATSTTGFLQSLPEKRTRELRAHFRRTAHV